MSRFRAIVLSSPLALAALAGSVHAQCGAPAQTLMASDFKQYAYFGEAADLGVSGGAPLLVLATGQHDFNGLTDAGKVYLFGKTGGQWVETGSLTASAPASTEKFGQAVALSDAFMAVGAPGANASRGAMYIFQRSGGSWAQVARLQNAAATGSNAGLGLSVAIGGTVAVAGAPIEDTPVAGQPLQTNAGAAYVYERNAQGQWAQAYRVGSTRGEEYLGRSVAVSNGTVMVGGPGYNNVRVIAKNALSQWTETVINNPGQPVADFGASISMDGNRAAIAAPRDPSVAYEGGVVHIYEKTGSAWNLVDTVTPFPATPSQGFGERVELSGDRLVVSDASDQFVLVFRRNAQGQWVQQGRVNAPAAAGASSGFGGAMALSGTELVVGARGTDNGSTQQAVGKAFPFGVAFDQADNAADAATVGFGTFYACTDQATLDAPGASPCVAASQSPDVWWRLVAPATGQVLLSTDGSGFDTALSVHSALPATSANSVACSDNHAAGVTSSRVTLSAVAGQAYLVRLSGVAGQKGSATLTISAGAQPPCYANCDGSTTVPALNALDFGCFLTRYRNGESYANCDASTTVPALNALDFSCFLTRYRAGCN